jgi:hypothetical protein
MRELTDVERHDETYDWAGLLVRAYVTTHYVDTAAILDVGAGRGKYRDLLSEYPNVDACEVYEPLVRHERLVERYRDVFIRDVVDLVADDRPYYDLVIMGDVLEHIPVRDVHVTLAAFEADRSDVLVIVPYLYPQGVEDGNVHQRHVQDDLTPELMAERYPQLRLVALETRDWRPFKGLYRSTWP